MAGEREEDIIRLSTGLGHPHACIMAHQLRDKKTDLMGSRFCFEGEGQKRGFCAL